MRTWLSVTVCVQVTKNTVQYKICTFLYCILHIANIDADSDKCAISQYQPSLIRYFSKLALNNRKVNRKRQRAGNGERRKRKNEESKEKIYCNISSPCPPP